MKRLFLMTVAVLLGIFSLTACGNPSVVKTKAGNITKNDLYKELKTQYGNQIIQNMVYRKLLESKYTATKKEVDQKVQDFTTQVGGSAALNQMLNQYGMTMAQFRDTMKTQVLLTKAEEAGIKPTDKQLQDYWNKNKDKYIEVKARHILVDKLSTAQDIEKKLKNGGDFAALAKKYSTDTGSKNQGGELGWVKKGQMVPPFETALFNLKKKEISQPVKSKYGYHIIQAEDIKNQYSDFKAQIKNDYLKSKAKPQQEVINQLIKDGNIQVKDSQFKDLFKTKPVTPAQSSSGSGSSSSSSSNSSSSSSSSTGK